MTALVTFGIPPGSACARVGVGCLQAAAQEQQATPGSAPARPQKATPQARPVRSVKDSFALLEARRAARKPSSSAERDLLMKHAAAALELKQTMAKCNAVWGTAAKRQIVHKYVVGLLKFGIRTSADMLLHDPQKLVFSEIPIKQSDVTLIADFVREQAREKAAQRGLQVHQLSERQIDELI